MDKFQNSQNALIFFRNYATVSTLFSWRKALNWVLTISTELTKPLRKVSSLDNLIQAVNGESKVQKEVHSLTSCRIISGTAIEADIREAGFPSVSCRQE